MASINYATREISCKIVYYGPGVSGKTTNLQMIHQRTPAKDRGEMMSLATEADRTLFFDFLPMDLGSIKGFSTKVQLYTVPGQPQYNSTRKLVLRGVDGVVFVVDSQPEKNDENLESFRNLEENLREYGHSLENLPVVLQYNKRDLPSAASLDQLDALFNTRGVPRLEATAVNGEGVFETLQAICTAVIDKFNTKYAGAQPSRSFHPAPLQNEGSSHSSSAQPALAFSMARAGATAAVSGFPEPPSSAAQAEPAQRRSFEDNGWGIVSTYKDAPNQDAVKPKPLSRPSEKKKGIFGALFKK